MDAVVRIAVRAWARRAHAPHAGSAQDVFHICEELLGADQVPGNTVCVVLEQRNHGRRLIEESKNVSFEANPKYAADMFAIMYGTALDMRCAQRPACGADRLTPRGTTAF